MSTRIRRLSTVAIAASLAAVALTGCTGSTSKKTADQAPSITQDTPSVKAVSPATTPLKTAPKIRKSRDLGVPVSGEYGTAPTVQIRAQPAPKDRSLQVLHQGHGNPVRLGQLLIAQYQITTWGADKTKPQILDDAFARNSPIAILVGARQTLNDWDAALIDQRVGSRVLLLLPGTGGASAIDRPKAVVVDILSVLPANASAAGTTVAHKPGLPEVITGPDRRPIVRSLEGVSDQPASQVVLTGTGPTLAAGKTLVLHVLQVDATSGKTLSQTWGRVPMIEKTQPIQSLVPALRNARVGSRAVAVLSPNGNQHAQILVLDILGQI